MVGDTREYYDEPWTSSRWGIGWSSEPAVGTGGASGIAVEDEFSWVYKIRDGKISGSMEYDVTPKPSKPWGCRSKTLTPTPEPAGYCAGDVAGERRNRTPRDGAVQPAVLVTTFDALVPGTVTETKRSIWALGPAQLQDGGTDNDADTTGDNTLFMTQGLFVP